nr:Crp/Fnr family transcriptional regulator [uncultured Butyrivibrio sp.]
MPLFKGIKQSEIESMIPCLGVIQKRYSKNQFIIIDSEDIANVGLVIDGRVHMLKEDHLGNRSHVSTISVGGLFGESFALRERPSYVSFQAATDSEILRLPLDKIIYYCSNSCPFHKRLVHNTFALLSEKNEQLMKSIEILSKGTLRDKIVCYLSQIADSESHSTITVPLNRTEMAAFLNSNRSAMTRELSKMQDEGLIEISGNRFRLLFLNSDESRFT